MYALNKINYTSTKFNILLLFELERKEGKPTKKTVYSNCHRDEHFMNRWNINVFHIYRYELKKL